MIVITGATGALGSRVVEALLARVPAEQVGVSVRDEGRAADLAARGVRVRRGDYADPDSLAHAFEGAEAVLVVSSNGSTGDPVTQNLAVADAAWAAGAVRVVYTSHQAASPDSFFPPMPVHARTQELLAARPGRAVALRHGFYASTLSWLVGDALETGSIVAPADGPVSWTTHDDLAAADAAVLADPGRLDDLSPPLTAAEAVDLAGVAATLSEITGRTITRTVVDDDAHRHTLVAAGVPAPRAEFLLGMFRAARAGEFDVVDPTLGALLGRPPTPVRAVLEGIVAGR